MEQNFTLPSLQAVLDDLPAARSIGLSRHQIEGLFGRNDVLQARLMRFARSHNCIVSHADGCVVFHKLPPQP
jgi:hypothetical protein